MNEQDKNDLRNFIDRIDLEPIQINNDPESSVIIGLIAAGIVALGSTVVICNISEIMTFVRTVLNSW